MYKTRNNRRLSALELMLFILVALSLWPKVPTVLAQGTSRLLDRKETTLPHATKEWRKRVRTIPAEVSSESRIPVIAHEQSLVVLPQLSSAAARSILKNARRYDEGLKGRYYVWEKTDYVTKTETVIRSYALRAQDGFEFHKVVHEIPGVASYVFETVTNRDGVWRITNDGVFRTSESYRSFVEKPRSAIADAQRSGEFKRVAYQPAFSGEGFDGFEGIFVVREEASLEFLTYQAKVLREAMLNKIAVSFPGEVPIEVLKAFDKAAALRKAAVREYVVDTKLNLILAERTLTAESESLSEMILREKNTKWVGPESFFDVRSNGPKK